MRRVTRAAVRARRTLLLLLAALLVAATAAPAAASGSGDGEYSSIYPDGDLAGAGWANCPTAITWDADVSDLSPTAQRNALSDLGWAVSAWGRAAQLPVARGTEVALAYNNSDATVRPGAQAGRSRKIYVKFVKDQDSSYLSGRVVGVGTPTDVIRQDAEIITGSAAFRVDYVEFASKSEARALLLHEMGHALGLGHSSDQHNVMYEIVTTRLKLGSGDVAGIRAFRKNCNPAYAKLRGQ